MDLNFTIDLILYAFEQEKNEYKRDLYNAWRIGNYCHIAFYSKEYPDFEIPKPKEEMTDEQIFSNIKTLNSMYDGEVI